MREMMEVVHQGDEDTGAAAAKGVTQGNGAAAHVCTLLRQAELVQDLWGKQIGISELACFMGVRIVINSSCQQLAR